PFGPRSPTISPDATSRFTPRTTVRPPYDLVRPSVRSVATSERAAALRGAFALRAELFFSVENDGVVGFVEGQRGPDRLATAFVDDANGRARYLVLFGIRKVCHARAGRPAAGFAERDV